MGRSPHKRRVSELQATGLVGLLALVLAALFFDKLLFQPDAVLFGAFGDGLKNYFTPLWALAHDAGWQFTGMNYPHGEHLTYTDAQPLIVFQLRGLDAIGLPVQGHVIGWLNALMLLGVVPAAMLQFRIHRHYGVPLAFAGWTALVITFLSPQLFRWHGHYALGYVWVLPLLWYLTIRLRAKNGRKPWSRVLVLGLAIAAVGFVHLYYLLMAVLFLGAYMLVLSLGRRRDHGLALRAIAAAALGFVAVYVTIALTDPIADRTAAPWGFTRYRAQFESVFLPVSSPFLEVWRYFIRLKRPDQEGFAYVGFPGLLLLLGLAWRVIRRLRSDRSLPARLRRKPWRMALPDDLGVWLPAAALVLIFSMAVPFRWGLEGMLDWIPPLKQFRSPGRMAWVFFTVWTTAVAVLSHRAYRALSIPGGRVAATWLIGGLTLFWSVEAWANARNFRKGGFDTNRFHNKTVLPALDQTGFEPDDFQAILGLPFYHNGSEKLYVERGSQGMGMGMSAAAETGLPLINVMMSRTSLSQTLASTSLVSRYGPWPRALAGFDERPLLILASRENQNNREQQLLAMADTLWNGPDYALLRLPVASLTQNVVPFGTNGSEQAVFDFSFDAGASLPPGLSPAGESMADGLTGEGMFWRKGPVTLYDGPIDLPDSTELTLSLWQRAYPDVAAFPIVTVSWKDANGTGPGRAELTAKTSTNVQRGWVELRWQVPAPALTAKQLSISLKGEYIGVDRLRLEAQRVRP